MIKLDQYIPLHLCVFLSMGILVGYQFHFHLFFVLLLLLLGFVLLYVLWKKQKKFVFQGVVYLLTFLIGVFVINKQFPENQTHHFLNHNQNNLSKVIQIESVLKSNPYQERYLGQVLQMGNTTTSGKIVILIEKDSTQNSLPIGTMLLTQVDYEIPTPPKNPHTFDYAKYLRNQGVYAQMSLKKREYLSLPHQATGLKIKAGQWRSHIQKSLEKYDFGKDEMSIIMALVLGDKQFISKDVQGNYAASGTVHILAVSGLHVGVIFMFLSLVLKPLLHLKHGKIIVALSILVLLWLFALIAGLSGSVVRAVTMFSFITFGTLSGYPKSPILYALFTSFFFLLLLEPLFIFDVGFQLSYLAVLGIVLIQPLLDKMIPEIKWKFAKNIWQLITVSTAATLATLPLSLYYFHQFPGLFLLSNIVIVPTMTLILGMGLLVVILAVLDILPEILVNSYDQLLKLMNQFMAWIAHQETFIFREIPFTLWDTLATYLVLLIGLVWISNEKRSYFTPFLMSILLFQSVLLFEKWQVKSTSEMVVFHRSKETLIGFKNADQWLVLHSSDSLRIDHYSFLKNYKTALKLENPKFSKLRNQVIQVNQKKMLVVDSLGIYPSLKIKPNYLLLTQSSKINMERLIQIYQPQKIIADGSNYPSMVKKWKQTCARFQIPFHYTGEDGVFYIN